MGFTPEEKEVKSTIKRWGLWIIGIALLMSIGGAILNRAGMFADKILDPDKAIATYENFYQMHEQADQICNDIYIMQNADSLSGGFSKNERIMGLENKLNDVIRDYNAQSQAWTRSMWKSDDLPHTLKRSHFNCN